MGAKWPDSACFADLKEVRVRRRALTIVCDPEPAARPVVVMVSAELGARPQASRPAVSRRLDLAPAVQRGHLRSVPPVAASGVSNLPSLRLPRMHGLTAVGGLATLAVVLACTFGSSRTSFGRPRESASSHKGHLSIADARGSSKYLRTNGQVTTVVPGDQFAGDCTIRQELGAITSVDVHGDGRVTMNGAAVVDFGRVQVSDSDHTRLKLAAHAGELAVAFTTGNPMVEIKLPQGETVYASIGDCTIQASDSGSTVVVRSGRVKVLSAARRKGSFVNAGQQLTIRSGNQWDVAPIRSSSQA
jgi:hypothetical protein